MDEIEEEFIIMRGRVKIFLRNKGKRISEETFVDLDKKVKAILTKAANRAEKNRRSTVLPWDI